MCLEKWLAKHVKWTATSVDHFEDFFSVLPASGGPLWTTASLYDAFSAPFLERRFNIEICQCMWFSWPNIWPEQKKKTGLGAPNLNCSILSTAGALVERTLKSS